MIRYCLHKYQPPNSWCITFSHCLRNRNWIDYSGPINFGMQEIFSDINNPLYCMFHKYVVYNDFLKNRESWILISLNILIFFYAFFLLGIKKERTRTKSQFIMQILFMTWDYIEIQYTIYVQYGAPHTFFISNYQRKMSNGKKSNLIFTVFAMFIGFFSK